MEVLNKTCFFVIDDTYNRKRRQLNKYSEYPDDCGAWQQGNVFIKSGEILSFVVTRGDMYSKIFRNTFVPLNPQHDPTSVVTVKRKYSVLGRNSNYEKKELHGLIVNLK
jgi:hypothetical protein